MSKPKTQNPKPKTQRIFAKKSLGQNFLIDRNYIDKIISSLNLQKGETVIEIGPGKGALTERLVEFGGKVLAIEIDKDLIPLLQNKFKKNDNFQLIEKDALEINFHEIIKIPNPKSQTPNPKLVANLPYYISTAILQHLIQYRTSFAEMVLMLQKEVVERITGDAGKKERGFLTVLIEAYFESEKLFDVPPNAFRPVPKVMSSVLRLKPKKNARIKNEKLFREIVSLGFQQKRKTIQNNLKNAKGSLGKEVKKKGGIAKILELNEIESKRRAETLTLKEWQKLVNFISENRKDD